MMMLIRLLAIGIPTALVWLGPTLSAQAACAVDKPVLENNGFDTPLHGESFANNCSGVRFHVLIREDIRFFPDRTVREKEMTMNSASGRITLNAACPGGIKRLFMEVRWPARRVLFYPAYNQVQSQRLATHCR